MLSDFAQYQQIMSCRLRLCAKPALVKTMQEWKELEQTLRERFIGEIAFGEVGNEGWGFSSTYKMNVSGVRIVER